MLILATRILNLAAFIPSQSNPFMIAVLLQPVLSQTLIATTPAVGAIPPQLVGEPSSGVLQTRPGVSFAKAIPATCVPWVVSSGGCVLPDDGSPTNCGGMAPTAGVV